MNKKDYSKADEVKEILKKNNITNLQAQLIVEQVSTCNNVIKVLVDNGARWNNLNPYILEKVINEYNERPDIDARGNIMHPEKPTAKIVYETVGDDERIRLQSEQ